MNNQMKVVLGCVISAIVIAGFYFIIKVSISNREISLRTKGDAQLQICKAYQDKVWKILKQKAGVSDQYAEKFKEIYPELIKGRYDNQRGGALLSMITESNPNFDVSLYKDLMVEITVQRDGFFMEQKKLIDIDREHKLYRKTFPQSWFIGDGQDIGIIVITSEQTENIYKTGKEDNIELFDKK